jgi:flagellar basal body rod protein FlgG
MLAQMIRQQVLAHNLANVNTPGFRHDRVAMRQFPLRPLEGADLAPDRPLAVRMPGPQLGDVATGVLADLPGMSLQQGPLRETREPLDLALVGPGFFAIQRGGETFYTRDGRFFRNAEGFLASLEGGLVLGADLAPIALPAGPLDIAQDGTIRANGAAVGQIGVFAFPPDAPMEKFGLNLVRVAGAPAAADPALTSLHQGFVEQANVDVTQSTTEVLSALRSYEANQRLLQMQDQILERVVTEVGRIG